MATKPKILHLITSLEVGGAEMMLWKTVPRLTEYFEQRVCCLTSDGPIGEALTHEGIPVEYLKIRGAFDLRASKTLRHLIKTFQPDALITYLIHSDLIGRVFGRWFGVKKIICFNRSNIDIHSRFWFYLDWLTSPLVSHYFFNSGAVAKHYQKKLAIPAKKITVVPNGIIVKDFQVAVNRQQKRSELGIGSRDQVLICVAKLRARKGHIYLLQAMTQLIKTLPDLQLLLVGDGDLRLQLQSFVESRRLANHVHFLGDRKDVPELLAASDIFILPTLWEGMSNAILEAMTSGTPIITTDIEENKELLEHKISALLVKPTSCQQLVWAIKTLIDDQKLAQRLAGRARAVVRQHYTIENTVKVLNQAIDQVLKS